MVFIFFKVGVLTDSYFSVIILVMVIQNKNFVNQLVNLTTYNGDHLKSGIYGKFY
jgi:hypothetical protein